MPRGSKRAASRDQQPGGDGTQPAPAGEGAARSPLPIVSGEATLRPLKTSESVARDVVHDIVSRGLQTGDRLPGEAAMLAEYGVSRESLREGLRLLEVAGLIILRRGPGGGPVVGKLDPANLGRTSSLYYHLAGGTYGELFEAWVVTESTLAERAARNPDRDLVRAAMQPYLGDGGHIDAEGLPSFVQTHSQFHAVVGSLSRNKVLEVMLQTIGQIVTHHVVVNADPREMEEAIISDHAAVALAVADGRPTKANALMQTHIERMVDFYKTHHGNEMHQFIEWR